MKSKLTAAIIVTAPHARKAHTGALLIGALSFAIIVAESYITKKNS